MLIAVKHVESARLLRKLCAENGIRDGRTRRAPNRSRDAKSLASETRGTRDALLPARGVV